ncbi:MAG: redox-sensing transcriptional repressor Rex, partial [Gemmatimonadota bacterium]|nr:redox-sensing transcriptional repressor Rex [Gemmatimonadota bacterium]
VPELAGRLREILGLGREWKVIIVGAGKIGAALARHHGFQQRGFTITAVYDADPQIVGLDLDGLAVRDAGHLERDIHRDHPDIAVLAVPEQAAQAVTDRLVRAGIKAVLNFAPAQLQVPPEVTVKTVNMAMELEGLSFALTNRE